jgi:hypothetical protein
MVTKLYLPKTAREQEAWDKEIHTIITRPRDHWIARWCICHAGCAAYCENWDRMEFFFRMSYETKSPESAVDQLWADAITAGFPEVSELLAAKKKLAAWGLFHGSKGWNLPR